MARRRTVLVVVMVAIFGSAAPSHAADYRTFRPDGPGPFPTVLFVAGCSGFSPSIAPTFYERKAERLRVDGYFVIFVDYLGARGLKTCAGAISPEEAGRDVTAALAHVRSQSLARPDAVTVIGWSFGGAAVISALATIPDSRPAPFRAVLLVPVCRGLKPCKAPADVLVFFGGKDDVAPPERCRDVVTTSATVKVTTYPEALHGFDSDELPARTTYAFGVIGYHKESATAAWAEIDRFLKASATK